MTAPAEADAPPTQNPHHDRRWLILAVLGLVQLMVVLDATIVNIALPTAQHALGFSDADRQWIVTGYALSFGSLLLLGGRLSDILGRKRALMIGLAGFAAASALGGFSTSFTMLLFARVLQGSFGALLAPAALAMLTTTFTDPRDRGRAFGIYGAISAGGGAIGLLLGGILTSYASWRWTLYVNVAIGAVAIAGAAKLLSNSRAANRPHLDLPGAITASTGLFALVYGFSHAETTSWGNTVTIASLVASAVLLTLFVAIERRVSEPLLPLRIVVDRNRAGAYIAVFTRRDRDVRHVLVPHLLHAGHTPLLPRRDRSRLPADDRGSGRFRPDRHQRRPSPLRTQDHGGHRHGDRGRGHAAAHPHRASLELRDHDPPGSRHPGSRDGPDHGSLVSVATVGLTSDAGIASAMVNTSQQVGGSVGTSLLNTLAASAATTYALANRATATSVATLQAQATVHGYQVVFAYAAGFLVAGAVIAGLLLRSGAVASLEITGRLDKPGDDGHGFEP